jgi:hypothetical protein
MTGTLVTFLLDRTGSMQSIKDDTIGAFNAYLDGLKAEPSIRFTLVQFDSMSIDKICVQAPIADVLPLTEHSYVPRAATPLIDAAYKTIKATDAAVNDTDTKVVICIQTDGHENASTEHTWEELNALIKEKSAIGWQFNFMGASIDAYDQASRMGIAAAAAMSYDSTSRAATVAGFDAGAVNATAFARGLAESTNYTMEQRAKAGDKFAHKVTASTPWPPKPKQKATAVDDIDLSR